MANPPPFFSVIIPTFNRPSRLSACLESIARLNYPLERFEVIVVDDGSEAPPEEIVNSLRDRINVRLFLQRNLGPAAARNSGAAMARGTFLAFTDDDCLPAPDWLTELAECLAEAPDRAVGGRTVNALDDNPFAAFSQMIIDTVYRHFNRDPEQALFFASNNFAVPAEGFRAVGGFDPDFRTSEDRDFCDRWIHVSRCLTYAPNAVVLHANNLTLISFCRQHFNYGRGALRFYDARSRRGSGGYALDGEFYRKMISARSARFDGGSAFRDETVRLLLLLLWLAMNTLGFAWEGLCRLRTGRRAPRKYFSAGNGERD